MHDPEKAAMRAQYRIGLTFVVARRARLNLILFLSKRISDLVPENHEWDKTPMQEASWMQKYFEKLKKFGVELACL